MQLSSLARSAWLDSVGVGLMRNQLHGSWYLDMLVVGEECKRWAERTSGNCEFQQNAKLIPDRHDTCVSFIDSFPKVAAAATIVLLLLHVCSQNYEVAFSKGRSADLQASSCVLVLCCRQDSPASDYALSMAVQFHGGPEEVRLIT